MAALGSSTTNPTTITLGQAMIKLWHLLGVFPENYMGWLSKAASARDRAHAVNSRTYLVYVTTRSEDLLRSTILILRNISILLDSAS